MLKKLSIKHKLLLVSVFSTLVVMLLIMSFWVYNSITIHEDYLKKRIASQGSIISNNIVAAVIFNDIDEANIILKALSEDKAIKSVRLRNTNQETLAELFFNPINETKTIGHSLLAPFHTIDQRRSIFKVTKNNQHFADILIEYSNEEIHELLITLIMLAFLVTLLAVLMGAFLSGFIQPLVTTPIAHLSNLARKVHHSKDYSLRGIVFYPDEVGQLTHDFNAMLSIIEEHDHDLEEMVKLRTKQLELQNKELETQINERMRSDILRQESEEKFEKAFINAPIGMALLDRDGIVFRQNQMMDDIFNEHPQYYRTDGIKIQNIVDEHRLSNLNANLRRLVSGESIQFDIETECFTASNNPLLAILSFSAVYNSNNQFLYIVLQFQDVTDARKMAADLQYQATHDSLTGVGNRRFLNKTLENLISRSRSQVTTLCVMDLDQFKIVNDTCGHLAGDELLKNIAHILLRNVREGDYLARLGGDEFALLLVDCDRDQAFAVTEKLRKKIEEYEFLWEEHTFRVGCSIGAVCIYPEENPDILTVMQQADSACYAAKDLGKNRVYIAEDEDSAILRRKGEVQWVNRIQDAIANHNFVLFVQRVSPLAATTTNHRFEVLIRMQNKEDGSLEPPGAFIPTAERYGLTPKIDRWVIKTLITQLQASPELAVNASYWVNLSGLSISDDQFTDEAVTLLNECGLPKGTINFEITETAVMRNIADASTYMQRLHNLGCQFALDDFGSGVSSFGYLKNLPVDYIKVDGMFVKDIISDEINYIFVKSIIDIAQVMGIKTIAEFVESDEIKALLLEMGADYGQGFAIGHPQPLVLCV